MSTINPISVGTGLAPDQTAPLTTTQETTQAPSFTPLWMVGNGSSAHAFEMMGIRMPNAGGDIAALLAQVALSLEMTTDESHSNKALASLAALASALATLDLAGLAEVVTRRRNTVDRTTETQTKLTTRSTPIQQQRSQYNQQIDGLKAEITRLETALSQSGLTDAQKATLTAQLNTAKTNLETALSGRQTADIDLAGARIESLEQQVADLEAQLAATPADSDERGEINETLTAKKAELAAARALLAEFNSATKTEATRTAFSNTNASRLQTETQSLSNRLDGQKQKLQTSVDDLENATFLAIATAARLTAAFVAQKERTEDSVAFLNSGVEDTFEKIAEGLKEVEQRAQAALQRASNGTSAPQVGQSPQAAESATEAHIRQIAAALTTTLADLVQTLKDLARPTIADIPPAPLVSNRLHFGI